MRGKACKAHNLYHSLHNGEKDHGNQCKLGSGPSSTEEIGVSEFSEELAALGGEAHRILAHVKAPAIIPSDLLSPSTATGPLPMQTAGKETPVTSLLKQGPIFLDPSLAFSGSNFPSNDSSAPEDMQAFTESLPDHTSTPPASQLHGFAAGIPSNVSYLQQPCQFGESVGITNSSHSCTASEPLLFFGDDPAAAEAQQHFTGSTYPDSEGLGSSVLITSSSVGPDGVRLGYDAWDAFMADAGVLPEMDFTLGLGPTPR